MQSLPDICEHENLVRGGGYAGILRRAFSAARYADDVDAFGFERPGDRVRPVIGAVGDYYNLNQFARVVQAQDGTQFSLNEFLAITDRHYNRDGTQYGILPYGFLHSGGNDPEKNRIEHNDIDDQENGSGCDYGAKKMHQWTASTRTFLPAAFRRMSSNRVA